MAKKKEENVEEVEAAKAANEETAENETAEKNTDAAENANTDAAETAGAGESAEEKSIVDEAVETASEIVGGVAEAVTTTASGVVKTASDAIRSVVGAGDEDGKTVKQSKRAERVGIVQSDKMTNTVVVRVDRLVKHPMYRKYIKRKKNFMAHDELGATIGDKVRIIETRPLSARKRWRVVEIVQKAVK